MKIEQGYRSRVGEDGAKRIKTGEDQEGLQGKNGNSAFQCGDATMEGSFPVLDGRKGKSLTFLLGEGSENEANIARSKALQEAVCQGVMQVQRHFQQQSHPQQTPGVHWERFLPQRQLQVLLVEDDDATRHVVSALLRNCSYEVTPAANGLLAWELLMDQSNHVDLVLTEVVMPCLSGIGLLARIMSHEAVKHIPVIMMSSHDAMNVVFKCLSKGAVDFLVKPVRKNELKNLWQHVWRRCNSSSGSRSASGSQTQKTTGPNVAFDPNDSGSNSESDKTSSEIDIRGGSDNGSGTQSFWTKGALEVESGHQSDKPNSTELKLGSGQRPANITEDMSLLEHKQHEGKSADRVVAPDLSIPNIPAAEVTHMNKATFTYHSPGSVHASAEDAQRINIKDAGIGLTLGNTQRALDLIGKPYIQEQDSNEEQQGDNEDEVDLLEKHASNSFGSKEKIMSDSSSPSLPESSKLVSMKRMREVEDQEEAKGIGGGLKHSYTSAFSRYNTSNNFSPLNVRTNVSNTQAAHVGCENEVPAQESHTVSVIFTSQKENMVSSNGGSDEIFARSNPGGSSKPESLPESSPPSKHGTSNKEEVPSLPPVSGSCRPGKQPNCSGNLHAASRGASAQVGESGEAKDCVNYNQDAYVYPSTSNYSQYHHHSHHHHHHHHIQHHYHHVSEDKLHSRPKAPQSNDQTVTDVGSGAPGCGSSNMANGAEGIMGPSGSSNGYGSNGNGAVSVNGSASGSNHGSKGQSAAAMMPAGGNTDGNALGEPDNGLPDTNGILAGHDENRCARREAALTSLPDTNGSLAGYDENRCARREAAITKFRQKRKERCFEKKVRYQSRKRLAEQRPRVRGQFVKQTLYGSTIGEPEQS